MKVYFRNQQTKKNLQSKQDLNIHNFCFHVKKKVNFISQNRKAKQSYIIYRSYNCVLNADVNTCPKDSC